MNKIRIQLIDADGIEHNGTPFSVDEDRMITIAVFRTVQKSLENIIEMLGEMDLLEEELNGAEEKDGDHA